MNTEVIAKRGRPETSALVILACTWGGFTVLTGLAYLFVVVLWRMDVPFTYMLQVFAPPVCIGGAAAAIAVFLQERSRSSKNGMATELGQVHSSAPRRRSWPYVVVTALVSGSVAAYACYRTAIEIADGSPAVFLVIRFLMAVVVGAWTAVGAIVGWLISHFAHVALSEP